ncbi:MAG TPA: sensor domain-containing diguanylate cyclase [Pirellulales bacterium]|jgi:diguanylate cyclase (GGDEF)-like protein|nr:sensor domain-containing diguanylate cyclase [Pirellulales bacterium]
MNLDAQSLERFALAAQCTLDGIWDWRLDTGSFYVSPRWLEMLGRQGEAGPADRDQWLDLVHAKDRVRLQNALNAVLASDAAHFEHEHRLKHVNGYRWVAVRAIILRSAEGVAQRMTGVQTDISDRKHFDALARSDSLHDALTQLPGRRLFDRRLNRAIERARKHSEYAFAVLFIDLDRFKEINDAHGHLVGDGVLAEVARRLLACVRPGDAIARRGGDEFTVLVDHLDDLADALRVAERIREQVAAPLEFGGHCFSISSSIGIATSNRGYESADDMLHDADRSMYQAKLRAPLPAFLNGDRSGPPDEALAFFETRLGPRRPR